MSTNQEKAQLTIRCALQSFSDYNVECELEWTVLQLKQYLARTLDFKPEVERQRLIYAGRYLENTQTIDEVIRMSQMNMQRPSGEQLEKQVIHMVYNSGKQGQMPNNNEGIRRRANVGNTGSYQNFQQFAVPNVSLQPPMMMPMYDPNVQQSHEAWMAAYQNYVGQMMHFYQNGGFMQHGMQMNYGLWNSTPNQYPTFGQQQQFATNQQQFYGIPYGPQAIPVPVPVNQPNQQQQQVPFIANPQPNNPPIDVAAAQMPDFLDLIYKSIRFALLAMIVYLYSSFERFISVLCIVALFWFVHARRGQQREQNGEPMAGDRVREQDPNQNNVDTAADNNNQPGNDGEADVNAPNAQPTVANSTPPTVNNTMGVYSGWNVFWTTIQSFFASLIPENPAPLDIN